MSELTVSIAVPARHVEVDLQVAPGRIHALVGPNGAGKSTVLQVIAGLLRPDRGTVALGRTLTDIAQGIQVAVHRRGLGLLAQGGELFPHLTVQENVEFAPRARRDKDARAIADHWLERVGAAEWSRRRPHELSGGQARRVGLARVFASQPQALLLDEPFAALDVDVADDMRVLCRDLLRERAIPVVLVTHDARDLAELADDLTVIEAGRLVESGPCRELIAAPRSTFLAHLTRAHP